MVNTSTMWKHSQIANRLSALLAILMCVCPLVCATEKSASPQATGVAMHYLRSIDKSASFVNENDEGKDVVFVGRSADHGWRIIVIHDDSKPSLLWDSRSLNDPYFTVTALNSIEIQADQRKGYVVTIRGCVPHQCADGKIGFAVYASNTKRAYVAHVLTTDGSYQVTYHPKGGIPAVYREVLDRMMCSDIGISRSETLPMKCQPDAPSSRP